MSKPLSYISISKNNLLNNLSIFRKLAGQNKIAAVVKANAYGHGLKEIVSIIDKKVDYFQVDDIDELREIRKYTKLPVFVFGFVQQSDLEELVKLDGTPGVYDLDIIKTLNLIGKKEDQILKIHLKIDAYLGRQGILVEELDSFLKKMKDIRNVHLESVYSHFSNIEDTEDLSHARKQFDNLIEAKNIAEKILERPVGIHISATSGILSDPKNNWGSSILRLGIGLYGLWPSPELQKKWQKKINLKPVLSWKSTVAQIKFLPKNYPVGYGLTFVTKKPTKICVIPQGYSDGYPRALSNMGYVLIKGQKCPIIGRVAMNMFCVDASKVPGIKSGNEVVMIGNQNSQSISAEDLAQKTATINYEIVARISPLLERIIE